jgi:hypothetical protein
MSIQPKHMSFLQSFDLKSAEYKPRKYNDKEIQFSAFKIANFTLPNRNSFNNIELLSESIELSKLLK